MTVMLGEVYDALRSLPGMDEAKARSAAEALGGVESRSAATDSRLDRLESKVDKIDARMIAVESKLSTLQWMLGFLLAGVATIMAKLFV